MKQALYNQEAAQEILRHAVARQTQEDPLLHPAESAISEQQLTAMADELGVSLETLDAAKREWLREQAQQQERQMLQAARRKALRNHALIYTAVNGFYTPVLFFNNVYGYHAELLLVPLLWGAGLLFHTGHVWRKSAPAPAARNKSMLHHLLP